MVGGANHYTTDANTPTITPPMRTRQPLHHRCEHANHYTTDANTMVGVLASVV
jgi:hypothetical protein